MRFKLKAGKHGVMTSEGLHELRRGAVIEADKDLAAADPLKWERVGDQEPAAAEAPKPQGPAASKAEYQQRLEAMSLNELRAHAQERKLDLRGVNRKEDVIRALVAD